MLLVAVAGVATSLVDEASHSKLHPHDASAAAAVDAGTVPETTLHTQTAPMPARSAPTGQVAVAEITDGRSKPKLADAQGKEQVPKLDGTGQMSATEATLQEPTVQHSETSNLPQSTADQTTAQSAVGTAVSSETAGAQADAADRAGSTVTHDAAAAQAGGVASVSMPRSQDDAPGETTAAEIVPEATAMTHAAQDTVPATTADPSQLAVHSISAPSQEIAAGVTPTLGTSAAAENVSGDGAAVATLAAAEADGVPASMAANIDAAVSDASKPASSLGATLPSNNPGTTRLEGGVPAKAAASRVFRPPSGWTATPAEPSRISQPTAAATGAEATVGNAVGTAKATKQKGRSAAAALIASGVSTTAVAGPSKRQTRTRQATEPAEAAAAATAGAVATAAASSPGHAAAGKSLVGCHIEIWWSADKQYYKGLVKSFNVRKVHPATIAPLKLMQLSCMYMLQHKPAVGFIRVVAWD